MPHGNAQEEHICTENDVYAWYPKALPPARPCRSKVESGRILVRECRQSLQRPVDHLCLPRRSCHGKRAWSSDRPSSTIGDPKRLPMVVPRYK